MDLEFSRTPFAGPRKKWNESACAFLLFGSKCWHPVRPKYPKFVWSIKSGGERQTTNRLEEGLGSRILEAGYIIRSLHNLERSTWTSLLPSLRSHVWIGIAIDFLPRAGAIYADESGIHVNGKTYFVGNSVKGELAKVWIRAISANIRIESGYAQKIEKYFRSLNCYITLLFKTTTRASSLLNPYRGRQKHGYYRHQIARLSRAERQEYA